MAVATQTSVTTNVKRVQVAVPMRTHSIQTNLVETRDNSCGPQLSTLEESEDEPMDDLDSHTDEAVDSEWLMAEEAESDSELDSDDDSDAEIEQR